MRQLIDEGKVKTKGQWRGIRCFDSAWPVDFVAGQLAAGCVLPGLESL
ncbi:MAG TPA: hypothetical protein VK550_30140 [Polyangiaceae bacterium]|nr:hypothetical protein [Polyangiaceae bacterium]